MSTNVNVLAGRLSEIGVINNRTAKALTTVMAKPHRDPQFPGLVDQLLGQVEGWHELANSLDYTTNREFAIIVDKGIKHIVKFAKANVSADNIRTKNYDAVGKKLTALDGRIHEIETEIINNPEGVTRMNIRQTSLDMLATYKTALTKIRSTVNDQRQLELIDSSMAKLNEIETHVASVVDVTSKVAAKTQSNMFAPIIAWAEDFANGNYSTDRVNQLDKAVTAAKTWAKVPLNLRAKEAAETDYVHEDKIHQRMVNYANSDSAVEKIENAINLIDTAYTNLNAMTDTTEAERQKSENTKEIEQLQARQTELTYLAQTGQIDVDDALEEAETLGETIEELREANLDLSADIADSMQLRTGRKTTLDDISKTFKKLLQYKSTPELINLAAKYINFDALTGFLSSTNNTALEKIMDIKQIDKMITDNIRKVTDDHKAKLDEDRKIRREEREERRQQRQQRRGNDPMVQESREEKLRKLAAMAGGAAAAPDNVVHADSQYAEQQQNTSSLNLTGLEN